MQGLELDEFLQNNNLTDDEWGRSKAEWDVLQAIAAHHDERKKALNTAAEAIASHIQTFKGVHSVRWRVKDTQHLLEKIVRKKLDPQRNRSYTNINAENYTRIVTDLIGVRALHLFKDDSINIDRQIQDSWDCTESVIYTRRGDSISPELKQAVGKSKEHPKGYRSVHYIIKTKPQKFQMFAEIQVRTLFEEGWSEIDHTVRYPNFSDNAEVEFFLGIFNVLAGNADLMGSFVKLLAESSDKAQVQHAEALFERDEAVRRLENMLGDLEEARNDNDRYRDVNAKLKRQIAKLKSPADAKGLPAYESYMDSLHSGRPIGVGPSVNAMLVGAFGNNYKSLLRAQKLATPVLDSLRQLGFAMPPDEIRPDQEGGDDTN
ncbi:hypothetical protein PSGK_08405 [Pseudomonas solani]|uniref:RelA/SpoT domain-containing protein n=1 Tax=Pseudomonas solani TaxID=2731552 RepID=UPI0035BE8468